jgi:nucleotide-binding universal stress UspA family protein
MSAPDSTPQSAPDVQREIEQTRERLGQTVEELAAKADVKARAQAKVAEVKTRARVKVAEASEQVRRNEAVRRDWPLALIAAGILVMGAALVRRRRTT